MDAWDSFWNAYQQNRDIFAAQTAAFLSLAAQGVGLALTVGVPMGILLTRVRRLSQPAISVLAVVQTLPSLALLGLLIPWLGIGRPPTLTATVLYSLLPIVMNTYVGISQVSPSVRDAAVGMGMTWRQVLLKVELPLALPVMLAGVRTGVVYAIGVITVCALAGAGGLGEFITRGLSRGDDGLVLLGAVPILVLTLMAFWAVGGIAALARRNASLGLIVAAGLSLALAGYAAVESLPGKERAQIVIGSKNFTENIVLAELMRHLIEAHTDLEVQTRYSLGSNLAYKALSSGDIDLYPEYTGTLLTAVDALNQAVPEDRSSISELVRREIDRRFGLMLLEEFGFNNTHAMCVPRPLAAKLGLATIGDLSRTPRLRAAFASEFLDRPDGWPRLAARYSVQLDQAPRTMEPALMYVAVGEGQADLVSGFSTDWQIQKYDLTVLEDDLNYFPSYHAAPLMRRETSLRFPELAPLLNRLAGLIDEEQVRQLNGAVVEGKGSESDVALGFLKQVGLLQP